MRIIECIIANPLGLHARPAGLIVKESCRFASSITVVCGERQGDGKKIFSLLSLGVKQGEFISIKVAGEDEEAAGAALERLVQDF